MGPMKLRTGPTAAQAFSLEQLAALTDISKRTIRYYIQIGLIPRPVGEGRAAHYLLDHLDRLLQIKRLSVAGVSLERIREVLSGGPTPVPPRRLQPGHLDIKHHVHVAPGLKIVYSPEETGLGARELRSFAKAVIALACEWGLENGKIADSAETSTPARPAEPKPQPPNATAPAAKKPANPTAGKSSKADSKKGSKKAAK